MLKKSEIPIDLHGNTRVRIYCTHQFLFMLILGVKPPHPCMVLFFFDHDITFHDTTFHNIYFMA